MQTTQMVQRTETLIVACWSLASIKCDTPMVQLACDSRWVKYRPSLAALHAYSVVGLQHLSQHIDSVQRSSNVFLSTMQNI